MPDPRPSLVAFVATLGSFATALVLERVAGTGSAVAVLAIVLAVTLGRSPRGGAALQLVAVPAVAVLAGEVARLSVTHRDVGEGLFVVGLSAGIWMRRFRPRVARVGRLIALPFIALLVTPAPVGAGSLSPAWAAVTAAAVVIWVALAGRLGERLGIRAVTPPPTAPPPASPGGGAAAEPDRPPPRRLRLGGLRAASRRGLPSTRMALQMAVALTVAFAVGRVAFPAHIPWVVLSAFIVNAGNRGRGDVVHKAALRLVGAAAGTAGATLLGSLFPPHDAAALVLLLVVLYLASWGREASYAFWAAGVTGVLALLYGYSGEGGVSVLAERVAGVTAGAAIGVAAAALVTPVRTRDVVRRRVADALAALAALLETPADAPGLAERRAALATAVTRLDEIAPALEAERRLLRRWRRTPFHADAIEALRGVSAHVAPAEARAQAELDALADGVGVVRRTMAGRPGALPAAATSGELHHALAALHAWATPR